MTEGAFCAIMHMREENLYTRELLMAVRADGKGLNLIGGRVEQGENREQTAVREALEETGLNVSIIHKIGDDLPMWKEGQISDVASIYLAQAIGGELKCTEESAGFVWVSKNDLPIANIVKRPCPGFPMGRTYAMAN
jgi:8-oxo-dGTP diphosphatase